jgi:anti-anti-sigma factor
MLTVNLRNVEEAAIVYCVGRIVAGEEVATLKRVVLAQADRKAIVLDLCHVELIDGAGMGALVFLQGWTRAAGIRLQLANPSHHVRELLELTNLDSVLEISPSPDLHESVRKSAFAVRSNTATSATCAHR